MPLTAPIAPKLYDDPVIAYNEIAATVPAGDRYVQEFDYSIKELAYCNEPTTLQVEFMDAIGTVVASTQEASWGGKKVSEITLQPGVYGMYPLANQNVDRGLLQVRIYSSVGGWQLI